MTFVRRGRKVLEERMASAFEMAPDLTLEVDEQVAVPGEETRVDQRAHLVDAIGEPDGVPRCTHAVAELATRIPQRIHDGTVESRDICVFPSAVQEEEVEI